MNGGLYGLSNSKPSLRIAVITPAKNEKPNLVGLSTNIAQQSRRPDLWLIVDDASDDGSPELASRLAAEHSWTWALSAVLPCHGRCDRTYKVFEYGIRNLPGVYDLIMKLDADTRLPSTYLDLMAHRFSEDARLGIASGVNANEWTMGHHLRGNNRMYRWECWNSLSMPSDGIGWDTLDAVVARRRGWRTAAFPNLCCFHLRGRLSDARYSLQLGMVSRHLGYYPWYAAGRAALILVRQGAVQSVSYMVGYLLNHYGIANGDLRMLIRDDQLERIRGLLSHSANG